MFGIENAIEVRDYANCHDFINKSESSYDIIVGENGNKLSAGEGQRIFIVKGQFLLEESTGSLDVKEAIKLSTKKKTVIIIGYILSVIKNADKILAMWHGASVKFLAGRQEVRVLEALLSSLFLLYTSNFTGLN